MGKIDHAVAKQMVNNYAETRKKLIDQAHGINDTQSIWFSIAEVKQFVADLSAEVTGVRIYLGAYHSDYPSTPNQTCIIAIGTVKDAGSGKEIDSMQQAVAPLDGSESPPPHNQGAVCPPIC